jgi:hypothetical protein
MMRVCYFGLFAVDDFGCPPGPCDGQLVRCHLLPQRLLKRHRHDPWDARAWVWGCGGAVGVGGHHGRYDAHFLLLPRDKVPAAVEELADELGLTWYLDRNFRRAASL